MDAELAEPGGGSARLFERDSFVHSLQDRLAARFDPHFDAVAAGVIDPHLVLGIPEHRADGHQAERKLPVVETDQPVKGRIDQ